MVSIDHLLTGLTDKTNSFLFQPIYMGTRPSPGMKYVTGKFLLLQVEMARDLPQEYAHLDAFIEGTHVYIITSVSNGDG